MKWIDELPIEEAITLYYEKHFAMRTGDLQKLLALKNKCPAIFDTNKDKKIREMINAVKRFQASDRYKKLRQLEMKEKLIVINNEVDE